jgi:hypothetical protein
MPVIVLAHVDVKVIDSELIESIPRIIREKCLSRRSAVVRGAVDTGCRRNHTTVVRLSSGFTFDSELVQKEIEA